MHVDTTPPQKGDNNRRCPGARVRGAEVPIQRATTRQLPLEASNLWG